MKNIYHPPPQYCQNIETLQQHFSQLDFHTPVDTVFMTKNTCFLLIWSESKFFVFSWLLYRYFFQTLINFLILCAVLLEIQEAEQNLFPMASKTVLQFLCLIFLALTFRIICHPDDWKNHQKWLHQFLNYLIIFEGFKFLLNIHAPLVNVLAFVLFFLDFHHKVSIKLENCMNALPPEFKIMRFELLLIDFSLDSMIKKTQEKFLYVFFINARSERFIYEYDASYQLKHLSFMSYVNLLNNILTLPSYARLDLSGNHIFKRLTHHQRDGFLKLIGSKRHQVILNQNDESDLQRSFLILLSMVKQKHLPAEVVVHMMGYLIEPIEKELIYYSNADKLAYLGILDLVFEEDIINAFFSIFINTPMSRLERHTSFLPPLQLNWLQNPNIIRCIQERDKKSFVDICTDLSLNKMLNEHHLAKKYFS